MNKDILFAVAALILGCAACAGEAKVTWQEPDKYTDIREGNELRDRFREQLFMEFELMLADLANQLPDDCLFEVTVTDVDLAGEVNWMHAGAWQNIRIIKDIYWPRMSFSYTLKHTTRGLLASGQEDIKDLAFMSSDRSSARTRFGYEEKMLKSWFKKQQRDGKFPVRDKPAKPDSNQKP